MTSSRSNQNLESSSSSSIMQSLDNALSSICDYYQSTKSQIKNSEPYIQYLEYKQTANREYLVPTKKFYRQLPSKITELKFNLFQGYTFNQRFMIVNGIALLAALFAFRGFVWNGAFSHSLRVIKNTTLCYMGVGLLFTPQIYNPLIKEAPSSIDNLSLNKQDLL